MTFFIFLYSFPNLFIKFLPNLQTSLLKYISPKTQQIIIKIQKSHLKSMNIKISIKDCECQPTVITKKEISEVEFKKKNMLYAPPTKDPKPPKTSSKRQTQNHPNPQSKKHQPSKYTPSQQDERKFLYEMSQISKNQLTSGIMQGTNTILQRQAQILQENQRTIHHLVTNPQNLSMSRQDESRNAELKRVFQQAADKIAREVREIKKMRDEIIQYGENVKKTSNEAGKQTNISQGSQQIGEMNSNLKNMVELSKNHLQGLQNLQGIKSLQNFNIEAYTQSINTLKKQIVQYQKQSENIQRELKLRAAKLQKLQISPNFQEELLQPYEQHLKKKADSIDLHGIKEKVYQKLGVFDYGKFETDVCTLANEIKNEMNDFYITCKQFKIQTPDIKIDKKELKQLDLKLPSVLDEFKASKGIVFRERINADEEAKVPEGKKMAAQQVLTSTSKEKLTQTKSNPLRKTSPRKQDFGEIYTKPVDLSKNTKLTRTDQQKPKTVLETSQQKQRKQVSKNIKRVVVNQEDDFEKYLENRAKEQLAAIYEEKRKKLEQMEKELYMKCQEEPEYELTMNVKNRVEPKKVAPKQQKQQSKRDEEQQYGQDFEEQQQEKPKRQEPRQRKPEQTKQAEQIKNIGTQVLRQKLKNLFTKNPNLNEHVHQNRLLQPEASQIQATQMTSIAQGFINMINNTLTQVNTQLSQSIQKKIQNRTFSQQRRPEFERRSPNKITVPKLEEFRAPPVFNMQMVYEPSFKQEEKKVEKKIVPKDYNYLRIQEENNELEISSISNDQ